MNILALDLGTKCGWALSTSDLLSAGTWNLKPSTFDSSGIRYTKLKVHLLEIIYKNPITKLVYEEVHAHIGVDSAHVYGGFRAIVQSICLEHGIPFEGIGVQTIKKHATGSGNAKKEAMILAAVKKWPSYHGAFHYFYIFTYVNWPGSCI